jgi:hypothetical protein
MVMPNIQLMPYKLSCMFMSIQDSAVKFNSIDRQKIDKRERGFLCKATTSRLHIAVRTLVEAAARKTKKHRYKGINWRKA